MNTRNDRRTVDLLDPELYRENPHETWAWMRANEPVYWDEKNKLWGITRHADVMDVERRSSVFSSEGVYRAVLSPGESNMIAQDDPRHRQQRMLVQPQLTHAGVARRTTEVEELVAELVAEAVSAREFDVIDLIAGQLPARLTARLLGFPEEIWPQVKSWSERLMRTDMRDRDECVMSEFMDANREFLGAMMPIMQEVATVPRDDFMSIWTHATIDGQPLPPEAIFHETGCRAAIYLTRPGAGTRVHSWTPKAGPIQGYLITHNEAISIADYLTVEKDGQALYRPTVHYAYHPCDDTILSLHELQGRNMRRQSSVRLMNDEIVDGMDELGVLLYGHPKNAFWYGSQLSIHQARAVAPYQNATGLQVTSAVRAGMIWAIENPRRGVIDADELDHDRILSIQEPYLGTLIGAYTDWTPLDNRGQGLFPEDIDRDDPWQFKNIIVR